MYNVILFGPPGAGKGTQAEILAEELGVQWLATGAILRAAAHEGTALGRRAKAFMDAGELVPDEVVIGIVKERLARPDHRRGFILDGFPRTLAQAEALTRIIEELGIPEPVVIELRVPNGELVRRLSGRRVCEACEYTVHADALEHPNHAVCPECGAKLVRRDDDAPETIQERLRVYERDTSPLIQYYEGRDSLRAIDGSGSVAQIAEAALRTVKEWAESCPAPAKR